MQQWAGGCILELDITMEWIVDENEGVTNELTNRIEG
jgi:hypothetical protein